VLYVDSSVLVKHYAQEVGTSALEASLEEHSRYTPGVLISDVGYAEILATFARRLGLAEPPHSKVRTARSLEADGRFIA
jgi:predicted nucleic acid-binding protein